MPMIVQILWAALLVLVLLLLPFIVLALHRTWRASQGIDWYFGEMLKAALGIAGNTQEIPRLDDTIETASALLTTAGGILDKAGTIRTTLAQRAGDEP